MFVKDKVKTYLKKVEKENMKINAVLNLNPRALAEAEAIDAKQKKGRLYGYVIGVKSNINVRGLVCSCASLVLENYVAPYDAFVIEKIKAEDGVIIGMLNCDEFACGNSGEHSAFGATQNPIAIGFIPGGSSSGSAAAVAAGFCDAALGSDTGGSIRNPANYCGIVGVKPSYGFVSRYGLIDLSMSLDQIGPLTKSVADAALLLDVIRGKDERDCVSTDSKPVELSVPTSIKIGMLKVKGVDERIQTIIENKAREVVKKQQWSLNKATISHIGLAVQTYYLLVYAEFFSATRRFDGRRFGRRIEGVCGKEILRRILGGSEITKAELLGAYYQKALVVKDIIREEMQKAFKEFDCLVLPTCPAQPWRIGQGQSMTPEEEYAFDALTIPANLAGICAVSVPIGTLEGIPVGLQIMCGKGKESKMLSIAKMVENLD